jgi:hypothetical protein
MPDTDRTGEVAYRQARVFAGGSTLTEPPHQTRLERLRQDRRQRHQVEVEIPAVVAL